jgi:hypothetical protein
MSLAELQRQVAAATMTPLTADEGMRARTLDGRSTHAIAKRIIAPNSQLSAFERLELYNRQYWFRVLSALAEDFNSLRALLGSRVYDELAIAYLSAHPNRSFTLRNLGCMLPEWLAQHAEYAGRRHALAVDVARIEWAFVEAFDNAALKPLAPIDTLLLTAESRVRLQPHLRLLALNYPADTLVLDVQHRERGEAREAGVAEEHEALPPIKLTSLRAQPTWLAVHRVEYNVFFKRIVREEFSILASLAEGQPLAVALEIGFKKSRIPAAKRAEHLRAWFQNWAELGWLCAAV